MIFQDFKIVRGIVRLNLALVALFVLSTIVSAQDFKLAEYLKRKDVNSNGKLEPSEMSSNTRSYLSKNGFNPEKSVSISKILSKLDKDKANKEKTDRKMNRERKVPGFGVEREESGSGVARFGSTANESKGSTAKKVTYSESVNRQVESTLGRYDRNKDGSLDKEEMSKARWGSPTPQESDTNKDGRLSRSELSNRYASPSLLTEGLREGPVHRVPGILLEVVQVLRKVSRRGGLLRPVVRVAPQGSLALRESHPHPPPRVVQAPGKSTKSMRQA